MANPCCIDTSHVTNFGEPGFLQNILSDLTKLKFQLKKKLQPATVLDGIELVCGTGCSKEKIEQTLTTGWALDPVHPSSHVYAKMALNLIEAVAAPKSNSDSKKRKRSEVSGSGSGTSSQYGRQPRPARSNESPRSHFTGPGFAAANASSTYGPGSGYGPGYGYGHTALPLCGPGVAPSRSPAGGPWAASQAQLTEVATTVATAEAVAAVPVEEARSEAARGRGGNPHHHQSRIHSKTQSSSPFL